MTDYVRIGGNADTSPNEPVRVEPTNDALHGSYTFWLKVTTLGPSGDDGSAVSPGPADGSFAYFGVFQLNVGCVIGAPTPTFSVTDAS